VRTSLDLLHFNNSITGTNPDFSETYRYENLSQYSNFEFGVFISCKYLTLHVMILYKILVSPFKWLNFCTIFSFLQFHLYLFRNPQTLIISSLLWDFQMLFDSSSRCLVSLCIYLYVIFTAKANKSMSLWWTTLSVPFYGRLKSCQKYFTVVYSSNIAIYKDHFIYLPMQTRSLPFRHYWLTS